MDQAAYGTDASAAATATTTTTTTTPVYRLFSRTTLVNRYKKDKISSGLNEARDYGVLGSSDTNWTICKQFAFFEQVIA